MKPLMNYPDVNSETTKLGPIINPGQIVAISNFSSAGKFS